MDHPHREVPSLAMAKTLCPSCGYSPIPHGAEECPACHEPFAFVPSFKRARRMDRMAVPLGDDEGGATLMGGTVFTGAISVHPKQAVGVFLLGAFAWVVRASGAMGQPSPRWTYGLVAAALLSALLLYLRRGPSKLLAQFTALAMVLSALFLGLAHPLHSTPLMYAAHGVVALVMVAGEPGRARRYVGLALGILTAVLAMASLASAQGPDRPSPTSRRQELVSEEFGFRLALPPGFRLSDPRDLSTFPLAPTGNRTDVTVSAPGLMARLSVLKDAVELFPGCQAQLRGLGGAPAPQPLNYPAPAAFGPAPIVYPLNLTTGATGKVACAVLRDGRFLSLAVVSTKGDTATADLAFAEVGAGLRLQ